ncbi:MAG: glycoside hydrolase family 88 protein [Bacteroidota bacterium]|nr:glycoside hydrolase family 88 protein [Bacteroidota bacterium]
MKKIVILILVIVAVQSQAQNEGWSEKMAATVMSIWKDSLSGQGHSAKWTYDQGVVLKGIEGLWYATGDGKYFDYMQRCMDVFVKDDGSIKTYKLSDYNIDNVLCGRILLTLFKVTGKEKYYKACITLREQLKTQPRTQEGGFWHKKRYANQMWLDGLYMGEPFYAEYAAAFHETSAFDDIAHQFIWMEKHARDAKTGLLYHGWDESKKEKWANPITGCSPNFWARAMGWYGMALVDVLESFPQQHPLRDSLLQILKRYTIAIEKVQDAQTGLWWDILNMPGRAKNYPEASASSMFVYTIAKAVRLGYISSSHIKTATKGYDGIIKKFIKTENGQVNLYGTVSVSGLGGEPYRDGSYDYYMKEKVIENDPKGVGAFLLASNEIEMLPTLSKGKGKVVLLDDYFNAERKKDVTGTIVAWHYKWDEMDNGGFSFFGYTFNRYGVQTATLSAAPSINALKRADMYLIVDADTKEENPEPHFMTEADADVIYNWVKNGGVLILMHNDKGNAEFEHFNILAKKFGIVFNEDSRNRVEGHHYEQGQLLMPAGHPIFKTAKKVYLKEISTLALSAPAISVYSAPSDTKKGVTDVLMAVAKVGKGTVFAVGDPWVYNEYADGRKLPAEYQNGKAASDMVQWFINQLPKK